MKSPYRGGPPPPDDEPPPDFRTSASSARDKAFHWIMLGTIPAAATFVVAPMVSAATFAAGLVAGGVAYATHRRKKDEAVTESETSESRRG